jgi:hypothetical protein
MKNATPKLRKKSFTILEQACPEIHGFGKLPRHILPKLLSGIRHYGLLSSGKKAILKELQKALGVVVSEKRARKDWKQLFGQGSVNIYELIT